MKKLFSLVLFLVFINIKADECKNRGDLDILYCDENNNLVADLPKNPKDFKNPKSLIFAVSPKEDLNVLEELYKPLTDYLSQCSGKKTAFLQVQNNPALIEAMRSGRVHIASIASGAVPFAVNIAGAIPFAASGYSKDGSSRVERLVVIVKGNSSLYKLSDLKGKKVAHVSPSSNLGHMVPIAVLPKNGIVPGKDYKLIFSGKYDQSFAGVSHGDYDAAVTGILLFKAFLKMNNLDNNDYRIIYEDNEEFLGGAISHSYQLEPKLAEKIKDCIFNFKMSPELVKDADGADKYVPTDYKKDWKAIRDVAKINGIIFNKENYNK